MTYMQQNYYDSIGTTAYVNRFTFKFECMLLPIVNDKIRIYYRIPINDPDFKATFYNSLGR